MIIKRIKAVALLLLAIVFSGCSSGWLDIKSDISLTVPSTLDDFRALLNYNILQVDHIGLAELSGDDYYISDASFLARTVMERNAYIWKEEIYEGRAVVGEWDNAYEQIFQCNIVLDGLQKMKVESTDQYQWNILRGEALFYRAKTFFNLAQLFAKPYDEQSASGDLGIPLRVNPNLNIRTERSSVKETYDLILKDLKEATSLLDIEPSSNVGLPSRPAAYAALARCYLNMRQYKEAGLYADSSLQLKSDLLNFNDLSKKITYPLSALNKEVLLQSRILPHYGVFSKSFAFIPVSVLKLYDNKDLRSVIYFVEDAIGIFGFRGSFTGGSQLFHGSTTAEMYLIRAESNARKGIIKEALDDISYLLEHRYETDNFSPPAVNSSEEALDFILLERRKELIRRGIRWLDLRRLNFETIRQETLERTVDGQTYSLVPNDSKYTFAIPDYIISATGIIQNDR